jgi:hypothetical protein
MQNTRSNFTSIEKSTDPLGDLKIMYKLKESDLEKICKPNSLKFNISEKSKSPIVDNQIKSFLKKIIEKKYKEFDLFFLNFNKNKISTSDFIIEKASYVFNSENDVKYFFYRNFNFKINSKKTRKKRLFKRNHQ